MSTTLGEQSEGFLGGVCVWKGWVLETGILQVDMERVGREVS